VLVRSTPCQADDEETDDDDEEDDDDDDNDDDDDDDDDDGDDDEATVWPTVTAAARMALISASDSLLREAELLSWMTRRHAVKNVEFASLQFECGGADDIDDDDDNVGDGVDSAGNETDAGGGDSSGGDDEACGGDSGGGVGLSALFSLLPRAATFAR